MVTTIRLPEALAKRARRYADDEFRAGLREQPDDDSGNAVERQRARYYGASRCPSCGLKMPAGRCGMCERKGGAS